VLGFFFLPLLLLLLRLHRRGKKTLMPIQIFARSFLDSGPLFFESDASAKTYYILSLDLAKSQIREVEAGANCFFFFPSIGKTEKKTIEADRPSRRLFFLFSKKIKLHSYNWCSADYCEGGASKGTCHLKSWDTSKPGEIWGCSGAGQLWKVSFVFFSLSRENDERKSGFSLLRARYCIFFFRCCCCCSTVTAAAEFHRLVKGNMNGKGARRRISNLKTFGKNPKKKNSLERCPRLSNSATSLRPATPPPVALGASRAAPPAKGRTGRVGSWWCSTWTLGRWARVSWNKRGF